MNFLVLTTDNVRNPVICYLVQNTNHHTVHLWRTGGQQKKENNLIAFLITIEKQKNRNGRVSIFVPVQAMGD